MRRFLRDLGITAGAERSPSGALSHILGGVGILILDVANGWFKGVVLGLISPSAILVIGKMNGACRLTISIFLLKVQSNYLLFVLIFGQGLEVRNQSILREKNNPTIKN